jgi:hypothetical protein
VPVHASNGIGSGPVRAQDSKLGFARRGPLAGEGGRLACESAVVTVDS